MRLDYENLYQKVRTNLAKMTKMVRESDPEEEQPVDVIGDARRALAQRKLGRNNALR